MKIEIKDIISNTLDVLGKAHPNIESAFCYEMSPFVESIQIPKEAIAMGKHDIVAELKSDIWLKTPVSGDLESSDVEKLFAVKYLSNLEAQFEEELCQSLQTSNFVLFSETDSYVRVEYFEHFEEGVNLLLERFIKGERFYKNLHLYFIHGSSPFELISASFSMLLEYHGKYLSVENFGYIENSQITCRAVLENTSNLAFAEYTFTNTYDDSPEDSYSLPEFFNVMNLHTEEFGLNNIFAIVRAKINNPCVLGYATSVDELNSFIEVSSMGKEVACSIRTHYYEGVCDSNATPVVSWKSDLNEAYTHATSYWKKVYEEGLK